MPREKNAYLTAMGLGKGQEFQNMPWDLWLAAKVVPAVGGLFAHKVYFWAQEIFSSLVPKYGADVVGSIFLTFIAYIIDHNRPFILFKAKGFSDDMTKAFTDGMMGRGAPAVSSAFLTIVDKLLSFITGKKSSDPAKPAQALMPSSEAQAPNLDEAPAAFADMMGLLANSPKTRALLTEDLLKKMEQAGIDVSVDARSNIANCIGDLAATYKS